MRKSKYCFVTALAAAVVIGGACMAHAHYRHAVSYYPEALNIEQDGGQVEVMNIEELEKRIQASKLEKARKAQAFDRERVKAVDCLRPDPVPGPAPIPGPKSIKPLKIQRDRPSFFPAPQKESRILFMNDIDHWKNSFSGECKREYVRIIATGMLYPERLPLNVQRKMHQYGWNGYFHHLLKAKMNSDRFFNEAASAIDRVIESRDGRRLKLWEIAVIETIHTLNVHSAERNA